MNATMSSEKIKHYPVMLNQILSIITPQHGGTFIDCTFGGGSYSRAILKYPKTNVIAIDRDKKVEKFASLIEKQYPGRFTFINDKFSNLEKIIKKGINPKAIIFDLGFSTHQIMDEERGFSFNSNGPLNMQMGINNISAKQVVNLLKKQDLIQILKILGEEKEAKNIAKAIIKSRNEKSIETSSQLCSIINKSKKKFKKSKINPATKTFQALRIFVNKEISELIMGLISATKILKKNGILVVIDFHSIEDRIVKYFFKLYSTKELGISRYIPQEENNKIHPIFNLLQRKVILPNEKEIQENLKSRSAKLRYVIRNENKINDFDEINEKFQKYIQIESTKL